MRSELKTEKRPIVLMYGGGYDSQILLYALSKIKRKFIAVKVLSDKEALADEFKTSISLFKGVTPIFLRTRPKSKAYKTWYWECSHLWLQDSQIAGFSKKDYCIVTGHKANETSLKKFFIENKMETELYCPLIRYSDDHITAIYKDMLNWKHGKTLLMNCISDSCHPNIKVAKEETI